MISKNDSYFDPELRRDAHYIVTGYTSDSFCSDALELTDIRMELHRYLRYEQGFDAVIFFDALNKLYCYDQQSFDVLDNTGNLAGDAAAGERRGADDEELVRSGPMGRRRRSRPAAASRGRTAGRAGGILHHGGFSLPMSWNQIVSLLRDTEAKCAIVFSNINSLQYSLDTEAMQVLEELNAYRDTNYCVAVYLFRETDSIESILRSGEQGSGQWVSFFQTSLRPCMETDDATQNRVIFLRTPNRCEIRNLLNYISLREEKRVKLHRPDINALSGHFAAVCAKERWSLKRLLNRIEAHAEKNSEDVLSLSNWMTYMEGAKYQTAFEQLDNMIGIERVKEEIHKWYAMQVRGLGGAVREQVRSSRFAPSPAAEHALGHALNVCIKGAPGTGKTTIARLMGQLYYELGLLPQGQLVECSFSDLVSPHVGETPSLVSQRVQEAMGGVLFVDEAYSLMDDPHGMEAINQLVFEMSAYEGQFALILAGYSTPMTEFMRQNDGLARRIPNEYVLEDYSPQDMKAIFLQMVEKDPAKIQISEELEERLDNFFESWVGGKTRSWGNAGEAANLLMEMKRNCSARMTATVAETGEEPGDVLVFTRADIPERFEHCLKPGSEDINDAMRQIDEMIGLHNVKKFLHKLVVDVNWQTGERAPGNFIFSGPPGTGKTTVARKMGEILGHLGVLRRKTNNVVVCNAADLLNGSMTLQRAVEDARGGVLFIDEAHQLEQNRDGHAIIRELVPLIEAPENRMETCFICAGYSAEMNRFLAVDQGLERRFPRNHRIRFNNYTAGELVQILEDMAKDRGEIATKGYLDRSLAALIKYMENPPLNFGNGGFIRDVFLVDSISARNARLNEMETGSKDSVVSKEQVEKHTPEERHTLTAEDIPPSMAAFAGPVGMKVGAERTLETQLQELIGKEEIINFIRSKNGEEESCTFFDVQASAGLHYAISGPLGSGKHTVVRTIAAAWKEYGLLEQAEVRFVGKADLEAGYVGQTALKTQNVVEHAIGGTLVVEYPSALLPKSNSDNSFGPEALGVIVGAMSEHSNDLCVVFLDSREGMESVFKAYPSIRGSLSKEFVLEDLSPFHMATLFDLKTRDSMLPDEQVAPLLSDFFLNWVSNRGGLGESVNSWANGIEVDKLIDELRQNWGLQEGKVEPVFYEENGSRYRLDKRVITAKMFPEKLQRYLTKTSVEAESALKELMDMTGLQSVKQSIRKIRRKLRYMSQDKVFPGCYCYLGNPGTGKTTVAKLMGGILRAAGALSQGHVIVRTAREMGDSLEEFDKILKLAKNGILFIDEAHQLAERGNPWGHEVIKRLLTVLEDDEVVRNTCIILAGYPRDMMELFKRDSGLQSRFGTEDSIILFEDYTPEELVRIMEEMAAKADKIERISSRYPLRLSEGYKKASHNIFKVVCGAKNTDFGNARFVRNYLHDSVDMLLERMERLYGEHDDPPSDEIDYLTEQDIPKRYVKLHQKQKNSFNVTSDRIDTTGKGCIVENSVGSMLDEFEQSIVYLTVTAEGGGKGEGTGSIITKEGHVLTCAHVIEGAESVKARVYCPGMVGGDYREFECTVLEPVCADCDMAVLKLKGTNFKPLSLRTATEPVNGAERTLIMGFPLGKMLSGDVVEGLKCSKFFGRVASSQTVRNITRYYVDSTGLHGNSGSSVISMEDGRVIGVFSGSVAPPTEGNLDELNYFNPISYFWEKYMQAGNEQETVSEVDLKEDENVSGE